MVASSQSPRPWFAGREAPVYFFKVNRRPLAQETLLSDLPEDAFVHFVNILPWGEPVETGRRYKRKWILGDQDVDEEARTLTGQIGWQRAQRREAGWFDESRRSWVDVVEESALVAHAPFVYDGETGRLAVLGHPKFAPGTVAKVFTVLLNRGEELWGGPTVEWEVEPLLDVTSFRAWLERTDAVDRVTFTAKLPNPDMLEEFAPLVERLRARRAAALQEKWEAEDPVEGLLGIEEDPDARQMIAMAEQGYGHVTARGRRGGRSTYFNQRRVVKTRRTSPLPSTVGEMIGMFIDFAFEHLRRDDD